MSERHDPFEHDDAAYVLGLLTEDERAAFEHHLLSCSACAERVGRLAAMPPLLAGLTEDDLTEPDRVPMPDTVLTAVLRTAARTGRRRRLVVAALAGVAAACLVAVTLMGVLLVRGTGGRGDTVAMTPVTATPLSATVALDEQPWGTRITVTCRYASGTGWSSRAGYELQTVDRAGASHDLGSWTVGPGGDLTFTSGTELSRAELAAVQIALPDGTPVLRATS